MNRRSLFGAIGAAVAWCISPLIAKASAKGNQLEIGETVYLKSGGVAMRVMETSDNVRMVSCDWTAKDGVEQHHTFPDVCVTRTIPRPQ